MSEETKRLGAIFEQLTAASMEMDSIIAERHDYFQARPERWQESDKALDHEDHTSELETANGNIESAMAILESLLP